ncbi:TKL protein kinase [Phytophthora cinnamomi]|uniref:TKL protein kinase n=1 Tax=Phytophthora cinnamomi TaxID=4785 RepID=UPI0035598AB3|nr:TKL protein kinase [Phytophthora cinnamomi]
MALLEAVRGGDLNCIERELQRGVDVNEADGEGCTALMCAVENGEEDAVALLLDKNATLDLSNHSGRTVFDLAQDKPEMLALLLAHQQQQRDAMLETLPDLCASVAEAQQMSEHVLKRVQEVHKLLADLGVDAPETSRTCLLTVVSTFHSLLQQHSKKLRIERLVSTRTVVGCLRQLHSDIDALMDGGASKQRSPLQKPAWQTQWEREEAEVYKNLAAALEADTQMILRELGSVARQEDALKLLKYESEEHENHYGPQMVQVLEAAQTKLTRFSSLGVPEVPNWFLPEYEVQRQPRPFAHGSFGAVYHGTWLESQVVIKCVDPKSEDDKRTFRREARIWQKARHKHIVNFFEERRAVAGMAQAILVSAEGVAMLTDFGLSFMSADSRPRMPPGGAVRWKAPECMKNSDQVPTTESDVYSFGMCVVEAVTGEYPWGQQCPDPAVVFQVKRGLFLPRPRAFADDEHWQFVQALCAAEPTERLKLPDAIRILRKFADRELVQERSSNDNQLDC